MSVEEIPLEPLEVPTKKFNEVQTFPPLESDIVSIDSGSSLDDLNRVEIFAPYKDFSIDR